VGAFVVFLILKKKRCCWFVGEILLW